MSLFAALFSRRRSRQARDDSLTTKNAETAEINQKPPRLELDFPHLTPEEPPQPEVDITPRSSTRTDDEEFVDPASIKLPSSPQNGRAESTATKISKKRSLLLVNSQLADEGQPQYFKEGKRRTRRLSLFSTLRSRPSTAMSAATEPALGLPKSPVSLKASHAYFPPDPKFQLDLKPETFGKAFNGSTLPFVDEVQVDNLGRNSSQYSGWQKAGTSATTAFSSLDLSNQDSQNWLLPELASVMNGDASKSTDKNASTQLRSSANGLTTRLPLLTDSDKTEKSSLESLPTRDSLPSLPASPESSSSTSASRNSLRRFLSKRQSPHSLRRTTPSSNTATKTSNTAITNGGTA